MQVVVTATGGSAKVAASAVSVEQTGETKVFALAPSVGSASPSITLVAPVVPTGPAPTTRRRVAGH